MKPHNYMLDPFPIRVSGLLFTRGPTSQTQVNRRGWTGWRRSTVKLPMIIELFGCVEEKPTCAGMPFLLLQG
jgi:hypothetical protein